MTFYLIINYKRDKKRLKKIHPRNMATTWTGQFLHMDLSPIITFFFA